MPAAIMIKAGDHFSGRVRKRDAAESRLRTIVVQAGNIPAGSRRFIDYQLRILPATLEL